MSAPLLLIDRFLPEFHARTAHATLVQADGKATWAALEAADLGRSRIVRGLTWLRAFGRSRREAPRDLSFVERLRRNGFLELAAEPGQEMVFGIAGRFWRPVAERVELESAEEFVAFARDGYAKAAWSISVEEAGGRQTHLRTETRVLCFGRGAQLRFRLYWLVVGPFSGLIRRAMLRQTRRGAEQSVAQAARA